MGGVVVGAACFVDTGLVFFDSGEATTAIPPEVPHFLLLGVGCRGARVGALVACPSAMMEAMMSSSCLASVVVPVTLAAATSSSASTCSASSLEVGGVATFSLPFLERTEMGGSSSGSSSSSSY